MPLSVVETPLLADWLQVAATIAGAVILAKLLRVGTERWLSSTEGLTEANLDRKLLAELNYPTYLTLILGAIYISLPIISIPHFKFVIGGLLLTAILFVWIRAGVRIGGYVSAALYESDHDFEFAPVLKNLWSFLLLILAFFLLLSIWEVDITPVLASAGIAGIVLGIAAQDSLGNLFAGISLHLDRTFAVGDVIQLEDGTRGTVTSLSIRSTTIRTRDHIDVTIPNSELNTTRVVNESSPERYRRIRLDVGVSYSSNLEHVDEILMDVADSCHIILEQPEPAVRYRSFDDSAIIAQLQCYIEHPAQFGRAHDELIRAIAVAFREQDIKIPFPQRELTFYESGNEIMVTNNGLNQSTRIDDRDELT